MSKYKRIEKELKRTKQHYDSLIRYNPDIICLFDARGRLLEANAATEAITGYAVKQFLNQNVLKSGVFPDDDINKVGHYMKQTTAGETHTFEISLKHKKGHLIHLRVKNIPVFADERIIGFFSIGQDITERKQAERQLAATLRELADMKVALDASTIVSIFDDKKNIISVNDKFAELAQVDKEELTGKEMNAFFNSPDFTRQFWVTVRKGVIWKGESKMRGKNGDEYWLSTTVIPILGKDKKPCRYIAISQDITERKHTEELLRRSEKLSAVGQLAAGIAHEIRNPLTSLKGFVQLLRSGIEDKKHEYLGIMSSELERINCIVNELLMLAKPQRPHLQKADLCVLVKDVAALLETQAILNDIQITTHCDERVSTITCDENQLKQAFINILKNAIEASPKGGSITVIVKKRGRNQVLIRYIDNGCGIPDDQLTKILEPFFTTKEKGTGLGLMITHKIIEEHRGRIAIRSKLNRGTTFDVILPM
jgi:two-component system sporulation sensor kinase A